MEIIGRLVMIIGAGASFIPAWWAPLIAAPLIWQIWRAVFLKSLPPKPPNEPDYLTTTCEYAYLGFAVLIMADKIGSWYGGLIGAFIGFMVFQVMGLLKPGPKVKPEDAVEAENTEKPVEEE